MSIIDRSMSGSRGFALTDALVSAAILALGMTAVAVLNTDLVADGRLAKHRSQAVALAQDKIEELRTNLLNDSGGGASYNFATLSSGSDSCGSSYRCGSAGFARSWTLADHFAIPESKQIRVTVSWTESDSTSESVTLDSLVTWDNPLLQAAAVDDDDFMNLGGFPDPTGGGELHWSTPSGLGVEVPAASEIEKFGLKVVEYNDGVAVYDPEATAAQVWLSTDPGVIKLSGTIKLGTTAPSNLFTNDPNDTSKTYITDVDLTDDTYYGVRSLAADAGICGEALNDNGTPEDATDDFLDFLCFVGSNWYGRIGVMAIDSDGRMVNIEDYGSGANADRLCPHTYRYGSNCALTGTYSLDVDGETQYYCTDRSINLDFTPASSVQTHTSTGEPLFFGELTNQDFVIQDGDSPCVGSYSITGDITLSGDGAHGIVQNEILATASGDASGCSVREDEADPTTGTYYCSVPDGWTGTVSINAANCGTALVTNDYRTAVTSDQVADVSFSGCVGSLITVSGSLTDGNVAFDPEVVFRDASGQSVSGVACSVPGSNGADYECRNIPAGSAGTVVATASNCSVIQSAALTLEDDATADLDGWDESSCDSVDYVINGSISKTSNKWEAGSANTKASVTTLEVELVDEEASNNTLCTTIASLDDKQDSYTYSCAVNSLPGQTLVLTVSACAADASVCMSPVPTYLSVELGDTTPIPQKNFQVTP